MIPTLEEIESAKTPRGGYTREQLAKWGIPWPPPHGWKRKLLDAAKGAETGPPATATLPAVVEEPKCEAVEFDWNDDKSVILDEQRGTACYWNQNGELVIRQQASWDQDEDSLIFVSPRNIGEFLDKLCDVCGVPGFGGLS